MQTQTKSVINIWLVTNCFRQKEEGGNAVIDFRFVIYLVFLEQVNQYIYSSFMSC